MELGLASYTEEKNNLFSLSSMVEQRAVNSEVRGSSPRGRAYYPLVQLVRMLLSERRGSRFESLEGSTGDML